jgi:hypothetical protein
MQRVECPGRPMEIPLLSSPTQESISSRINLYASESFKNSLPVDSRNRTQMQKHVWRIIMSTF